MTDQPAAPDKVSAFTRMIIGAIAAWVSSYLLNQLSLAGVDFKTLGLNSEMVKSTIEGVFVGLAVTPKNLVYSIRDGILFTRFALKTWHDALFNPPPSN